LLEAFEPEPDSDFELDSDFFELDSDFEPESDFESDLLLSLLPLSAASFISRERRRVP
jgi:hypothetical protein